jgi:hypothetical protein
MKQYRVAELAVLFFGGLSVKFRSQRLVVATVAFGSLMFLAGLAPLPFP